MAAVPEVATDPAGIVAGSGTTFYIPTGETRFSAGTTEANEQTVRRSPGTFSSLFVTLTTNGATGSTVVHFRKNTANGNGTLTIASGLTGTFVDSTFTDTVVAGDLTAIQIISGAGGSNTYTVCGALFSATTGTVKRFICNNALAPGVSNAFIQLAGSTGALALTEAHAQFKVEAAGTLNNLQANCTANTSSGTTTLVSRVNTANGNLVISIPTLTTGVFEDTANSDTLAAGDLVCYAASATATGSTIRAFGVSLSTTNNTSASVAGATTALAQLASVTTFYPVGGLLNTSTTESSAQTSATVPLTYSNMQINLSTNTVSAASTMTFRVAGANGNQSITITASTSGRFEDVTHSDTVAAGSNVGYEIVTGGSGTSLSASVMGCLLTAIIPIGITPGTLTPKFAIFDTGQYGLGA